MGHFGDPSVMGGIMGVIIGILAGYDIRGILTLGIQMAAVIVLMPQVVKHIMNGLLPISEVAKARRALPDGARSGDFRNLTLHTRVSGSNSFWCSWMAKRSVMPAI